MREKIFLLLIFIFNYNEYVAQTTNLSVTQPVPTVSSLAAYNSIPVSVQTGVPNISYDLISEPTNNKFVNVNLGINYHVGNISNDQWIGDLGAGWSLLGQGVISREILGELDERFSTTNLVTYEKNSFDDIYNFSIPGESGKFRIIRNIADDTFSLVKLTPFTAKIEYTRDPGNTATLIISSFTITNNKGIKYKFDAYNVSQIYANLGATPGICDPDSPLPQLENCGMDFFRDYIKYRSTFFVTSVLDESDKEVVQYSYHNEIEYSSGSIIKTETKKLNHIEIKNRGIIDIAYTKTAFVDRHDIFRLDDITLKTIDNQFVKKYKMEYDTSPRELKSFSRLDKNNAVIEKTQFEYSTVQSSVNIPGNVIFQKALKNIKLPTGGKIEYNFDLVPYFWENIQTVNIPNMEPLSNITFDTFDGSLKKYYFTLATDKEVKIELPNSIPHPFWKLDFYKKVGNVYQQYPLSLDAVNYQIPSLTLLTAGEYYATLSYANSPAPVLASPVEFQASYVASYSNTTTLMSAFRKGLLRINNIKYYNDQDALSQPVMTENYSYNWFSNPSESSGHFLGEGTYDDGQGPLPYNAVCVYKNVKVSNGKGYTKYYFKTPMDYIPEDPNMELIDYDFVWPYYDVSRNGLLEKKEIYNDNNQKLSEDNYTYTFSYYGGVYPIAVSGLNAFKVKSAYIKNEKRISKDFLASGTTEETQAETSRDVIFVVNGENITRVLNYSNITSEKTVLPNGKIKEIQYRYAHHKNNQRLIDANMVGIPLETTVNVRKSASDAEKTVSKTETKYDNSANLFPSSVTSQDIVSNTVTTEATYDKYDSEGNLQQYTTKNGIPVAVIWGYHKTQPIAKIEGAAYDQISQYASEIIAKSDLDIDNTSEQNLLNALDTFRNNAALNSYQVTTYTYDPLIGVTSITPPSGIREIYIYDLAGRLKEVRENNAGGNILKELNYNYKP